MRTGPARCHPRVLPVAPAGRSGRGASRRAGRSRPPPFEPLTHPASSLLPLTTRCSQDFKAPGSQAKQYFLGLEAAFGGSGNPAYPGGQWFNMCNLGKTAEEMKKLQVRGPVRALRLGGRDCCGSLHALHGPPRGGLASLPHARSRPSPARPARPAPPVARRPTRSATAAWP